MSCDFIFFIFPLTKKNWILGALFTFFLCFSSVWSHYVLLFPSGSRDGFVLPSRCYGFRFHSLVVCCSLCFPYWFMEILCPTAALMRILGHTVVEACLCDECWKFSLVSPAFCSISVRKISGLYVLMWRLRVDVVANLVSLTNKVKWAVVLQVLPAVNRHCSSTRH